MNIREKAAGVICVGFDGHGASDELEREIRSLPLGGVILFGRNVDSVAQTRALTDKLRTFFEGPDPILAIDQEGGRVARIREGVVEIPSMMALAATGDHELARRAGAQTAYDLRRIGINVDFAPVLDLALHRGNTVIGARSFSDDPNIVTRFGGAFADGLQSGGVTATYKHFPGHGSTETDSHLDLPVVDELEEVLRSRDFIPFAALLPNARAVMTAHIVLRAFHADLPATLAPPVLTQLLRGDLGFQGVCFTDCMQMDAIAKTAGTAGGAVLALAAGADCVLISHSIALAREAVDRIVAAVASGALPEARLDEAFARVRALRETLDKPVALAGPSPDPEIGREVGLAAVTLVRGSARLAPESAIAVSFEGTTTEGVQGTHSAHASLREFAPELKQINLPLEPSPEQIARALGDLNDTRLTPLILARRAHVYHAQQSAVEQLLRAHPDAVLASVREPFDLELFAQARNAVATYGDDRPSMDGLARVVFGGAQAHGRIPVRWAAVR